MRQTHIDFLVKNGFDEPFLIYEFIFRVYFTSFVPHFEQKIEPSGFAAPHSWQKIKLLSGAADC